MTKHFSLGHRLPRRMAAPLFGDRRRHGLAVRREDPCWREWEKTYLSFYDANQRRSVGAAVNGAGYRVMSRVDLSGRRALEIGPGDLPHLDQWRRKPDCYVLADISDEMLERSSRRLTELDVRHECHRLDRENEGRLPFDDEEFDLVVSFFTFEHLDPIGTHLAEIQRVLKPGGLVAGAIPCEGGMAWGLGRYLTTRRWLKRHTSIDPDKIICWEHPNFAEGVMAALEREFAASHVSYWPLHVPLVDLNLVLRFVYAKR